MSEAFCYRPKGDILPDLDAMAVETYDLMFMLRGLRSEIHDRKTQRGMGKLAATLRRRVKIIERLIAHVRREQRWWAADEDGGWCYPPDVWYFIIALTDQLETADEEMHAAMAPVRSAIVAMRSNAGER